MAAFDPKTINAMKWARQAACKGVDPELFFPERGNNGNEAKAVCATCPVQPECLEYALINHERMGVWGGTTDLERRALWRKRRRWGSETCWVPGCAKDARRRGLCSMHYSRVYRNGHVHLVRDSA